MYFNKIYIVIKKTNVSVKDDIESKWWYHTGPWYIIIFWYYYIEENAFWYITNALDKNNKTIQIKIVLSKNKTRKNFFT